jgi:hypothetical protein
MEKWEAYLKADRQKNPQYYTNLNLEAARVKHLYKLFISIG